MLFCFTNISAEIFTAYFVLQLLYRAPYFGAFLPYDVAAKSIENVLHKSCFSALAKKMLVKLTSACSGWSSLSYCHKNKLTG